MIIRELAQGETALAYVVMRSLRPHLSDEESFVVQVGTQRNKGYRLAGVFDEDAEHARAVAGFRFTTSLAWGYHCYIDDLATLPEARGRGYGTGLLRWVHDLAKAEGASQVHLDSGTQPERQDAHRLYFQNGYRINSFHFSAPV
ncbi:GNAT family N-acetyltransferase [Lysinibacter sp. HNR]|uniref:GNAT family N-acetyltransferase n=1 Tax=Lysinibacter sp. HNR TaxID=3031408 RepID=UPI002434A7F6|nr:GNAT family N-acetyltransferase [Lysinibacter sp. HNR]WGD36535.1 GNAT family N-acetyltransferase [Lysinibacter sp. HNR]